MEKFLQIISTICLFLLVFLLGDCSDEDFSHIQKINIVVYDNHY